MSIIAGNTIRIRIGASRMPPTTTSASGFCTWLPMPVATAAGSSPTHAAMQVIITGRNWVRAACRIASSRGMPAAIIWLK